MKPFSQEDHGPEDSHPRLDQPPQPCKEASEYRVKEEEKGEIDREGREEPELAQNWRSFFAEGEAITLLL